MRQLSRFLTCTILLFTGCGLSDSIDTVRTKIPPAATHGRSNSLEFAVSTASLNFDSTKSVSSKEFVNENKTADSDLTKADVPSGAPRIDAADYSHDFGVMDPFTEKEHTFKVVNVGDGPLELKLGDSTCNCTVAQVPTEPILPGETGEILVQWQTKTNNRRYVESTTVRTNIPDMQELKFTIKGDVYIYVGADPPILEVPTIAPGKTEMVETIVCSQVWDAFDIRHMESSMNDLTWDILPVDADELVSLKSKAGYRLRFTLPSDLPRGDFSHWVRIEVGQRNERRQFQLPLQGRVVRPVAVYGPKIDMTGRIELGVVPSSQGLTQYYVVKVRDDQPTLTVKSIRTVPDFLHVQLTPIKADSSSGVYRMEITVPKGSPTCQHIADQQQGSLSIEFEHPRIESLDLKLDLAVVDTTGRS